MDGAEITSPNYPDDYPPDLLCDYLITAPEGSAVTLVIEFLETEPKHDWLRLYNSTNNNTRLLATYSGTHSGYNGLVARWEAGQNMFLQFKSDSTYSHRGFKLYYHFRPEFNHLGKCPNMRPRIPKCDCFPL